MADSGNKTRPTAASVEAFINGVENETRRADAKRLLTLMKKITGEAPIMWGPSMIGFGSYHYKYDSGREGDMLMIGFSPRKANLALYVMSEIAEERLARLGKHKRGKSCLYVNKLADVDLGVLEEILTESWATTKARRATD